MTDPLAKYAARDAYIKRITVQLHQWLLGNPIHNPVDNECVPDWSCCRGRHAMKPAWLRELFWRDESSRPALLKEWAEEICEKDPMFAIDCDIPGVQFVQLREVERPKR